MISSLEGTGSPQISPQKNDVQVNIDFSKKARMSQDLSNIFAKNQSPALSDSNDNASKEESNFKASPNFNYLLNNLGVGKGFDGDDDDADYDLYQMNSAYDDIP